MTGSRLADLFGVAQPVIAMAHFPALPGTPRHARGTSIAELAERVRTDAQMPMSLSLATCPQAGDVIDSRGLTQPVSRVPGFAAVNIAVVPAGRESDEAWRSVGPLAGNPTISADPIQPPSHRLGIPARRASSAARIEGQQPRT
jgi:hypothetical protein